MRETLAQIVGLARYSAKFARYGSKNNRKNGLISTVLLEGVTNKEGNLVCDHIWIDFTLDFAELKLQHGETISFDAKVSTYTKGYQDWNADKLAVEYQLIDVQNVQREPALEGKQMSCPPPISPTFPRYCRKCGAKLILIPMDISYSGQTGKPAYREISGHCPTKLGLKERFYYPDSHTQFNVNLPIVDGKVLGLDSEEKEQESGCTILESADEFNKARANRAQQNNQTPWQ